MVEQITLQDWTDYLEQFQAIVNHTLLPLLRQVS